MTTSKRRRIQREIQDLILARAELDGWTAGQIHHEIKKTFPESQWPHLRTVQRLVQELHKHESEEEWSISNCEVEDIQPAMKILRQLAMYVGSDIVYLFPISESEMRWLLRIHKASQDIPPHFAYLLAREYCRREADDEDFKDIDLYLMFEPWRSADEMESFQLVINYEKGNSPQGIVANLVEMDVRRFRGEIWQWEPLLRGNAWARTQ